MDEYNLIEQQWIPCIDLDGHPVEYGIRETLLRSHELREIFDESPLVTVSVHRLLLAVLYRAFKGPTTLREWQSVYNKGFLDKTPEIDKYLNLWEDRFNLFDEKHPFLQVADLDLHEYKNGSSSNEIKKDKSDGLMRLAREAPAKQGQVLFDHRVGTERPIYEPRQIARMILSAQSYSGTGVASSGRVGKKQIKPTPCQFAPCVEGFVIWLQGASLFHTLLINLVPQEYIDEDKPAWENDSVIELGEKSWKKPISFTGPVQRFVPLSRFIRVIDQKSMFFTNGLKVGSDSGDPMKAYFRPDSESEFQAMKPYPERAAWRDSHSLFSLNMSFVKPPQSLNHVARLVQKGVFSQKDRPRANLIGLATQQGKILLWRHERVPVPFNILMSDDLMERLRILIDEAETMAGKLSGGLSFNGKSRKTFRNEPVGRIQTIADLLLGPSLLLKKNGIVRTDEGKVPEEAHNKAAYDLVKSIDPLPSYWSRLERHFYVLLDTLPADWDEKKSEWKPDNLQFATKHWRENVMQEATNALKQSVLSLGTTARAIQAVARVRLEFGDNDLKR